MSVFSLSVRFIHSGWFIYCVWSSLQVKVVLANNIRGFQLSCNRLSFVKNRQLFNSKVMILVYIVCIYKCIYMCLYSMHMGGQKEAYSSYGNKYSKLQTYFCLYMLICIYKHLLFYIIL